MSAERVDDLLEAVDRLTKMQVKLLAQMTVMECDMRVLLSLSLTALVHDGGDEADLQAQIRVLRAAFKDGEFKALREYLGKQGLLPPDQPENWPATDPRWDQPPASE